MARYAEFSYVQARVQARHGEQPSAAEWNRLTAIASLSPFLQAARKGPLRRWIFELAPESGVHEMELTLRRHFRAHVLEVAGWMPPAWRPAVRWTRHVPDLPALAHLLAGNPAPQWVRADPELKGLASDGIDERRSALQGTDKYPLLAGAAETPLVAAWYRHWRRLWPASRATYIRHLEETARVIGHGRARLADERVHRSEPPLEALEQRLTRLFRRHTHQPATPFLHLALTALLLERLRGALATRMLFPPPAEAA